MNLTTVWGILAPRCTLDTDWYTDKTVKQMLKLNKFHVHQCQAQIEIWRSPDIHLTLTWTSPDHLSIIWPSPDPYKTLT